MLFSQFVCAQDTISLAGKWRITIDGNYKDWPEKKGVTEKWYESELPLNERLMFINQIYFKNADFAVSDWIKLPGSTDEAGIGILLKNSERISNGLERLYTYDGAFWVQRKITIPQSWEGKAITLTLERVLGSSKVFLDETYLGEDFGFAIPHKFKLPKKIKAGEYRITILINKDDTRYLQTGHHVVNGNGTSWNGIVGRIELVAKNSEVNFESVNVFPKINSNSIDVFLKTSQLKGLENKSTVSLILLDCNDKKIAETKHLALSSDSMHQSINVPHELHLWSEFNPYLYKLKCEIFLMGKVVDTRIVKFGMREISTKDGNITINNNKIFLRGTLDYGLTPLTGYPNTTKEQWLVFMRNCKSYGLNHVRFHTNCPPDAAFEAADEVGMYLQPELCGIPYAEINRILDTYGNHPSFCMLSLNNEAFSHNKETQYIIQSAKKRDNRHLYTCTTNPLKADCVDDFYISAWGHESTKEWPFFKPIVGITWGGGDVVSASRFNTCAPETMSNFATEIKGVNAPVIAHEMGQWAMFPVLSETSKYTGVLRNTNYERIANMLKMRGMLHLATDFAYASGKFSALIYKEEMESAMRTPNFAGYQLLGLHDCQSYDVAIIGILDAFGESKGIVSPNEHSQYCNSVVPLAKMVKRVWHSNETFSSKVDIANFRFEDIKGAKLQWSVIDTENRIIKSGYLKRRDALKGQLTSFDDIKFDLSEIKKATKLTLIITIYGTQYQNNWDFWVYTPVLESVSSDVLIVTADKWSQLKEKISEDKKILLLLNNQTIKDSRDSCFTPIFWNTIFKWAQKSHTTGILCNPTHPVFSEFPTESYSNWQWWDITMNAWAMDISSLPLELSPIIQVIDSYSINHKLAYLWECKIGNTKIMVSSIDFTRDMQNRLASKQLKNSILNYMNSGRFSPEIELKTSDLMTIMR